MFRHPRSGDAPGRALEWVLLAVFALVSASTLFLHEMWRDETHAWLIARESSTLRELLANLEYEGHPPLWHLCLYLLSRFHSTPELMQTLHWAIATSTAFLLLFRAPFTRVERALLVFGYFPFYEYCIKSRGYALGVLFLVLLLRLFPRRHARIVALSALLLLLSHTSVFGTIIAIAFGLTLAVERFMDGPRWTRDGAGSLAQGSAAAIWILGVASATYLMIPPADGAILEWTLSSGLERAERVISRVAHGYLPHLEFSYSLTRVPLDHWLGLGLLLGSMLLFLRSRPALVFYVTATGGQLLFMIRYYEGLFWHHGHLFLVWIAALWIAEVAGDAQPRAGLLGRLAERAWRARYGVLIALLLLHLVTGIRAHVRDWNEPYSAAGATAQYIVDHDLQSLLLVGDADFSSEAVLAYLDRGTQLYFIQGERYGSFVRWDRARLRRVAGGLPALEHARQVGRAAGRDVLFIASYEVPEQLPPWAREIERFDASIWPDERFYLYRLQVDR